MLERSEMEIFLTLCEELHFGRTATRLYVSTALISTTVKKIERRLGVALFERTSRRVELTSVGRDLRDDLLPLYEGIKLAMDRAELAGRGITGTLTVGFMGAQAGRFLFAAREVFELRNPDCGVRVVETQLHHHVAQLRDGTADLLLTALPVDEPDLTVGAVVTRGARYMCLATNHRLAGRDVISFEDLAGETFVDLAASVPAAWADFHLPGGRPVGGRSAGIASRVPRTPRRSRWSRPVGPSCPATDSCPCCTNGRTSTSPESPTCPPSSTAWCGARAMMPTNACEPSPTSSWKSPPRCRHRTQRCPPPTAPSTRRRPPEHQAGTPQTP